ncbi:ATP-grasp fold amidoligase family protein [Vibrio crassostreae]|uniref:WcvD n=1 Tax=Vibrio crassostreae TaxID=246167 RepID=A0ABP1WQJ4_9VIBR|nr:ATP-grasp fold amidoligase family protein [Vibrio crassostreae]TCL27634.1 teichuronopeptide biosynthesis TupA-like protein [Vibrio crassostreae]TCT49009.1 teichuronopeptide biosynthesis TupA-like protein [Vibrio crassostreae]TCT58567.1 teichuronopeptide biosynthesis TupA-like protein [Vibrio crassostreae]CAK1710055.1 WcvD [Vibrio crassostreae]CAK1711828.1 WcvD [Vibrio crassostreae]
MRKLLKNVTLSALPKNKFGDKLFANLSFCYFHKRLPNNSNNFIDVLHRVKTSGVLYDPIRNYISDKYLVKNFVSGTIGSEYAVPTIALLNTENEVKDFVAPDECIVKPCHSSGNVIFLKKGDTLNFDDVKHWLEENYYEVSREVNYKNLKKRIIVEPILYENKNLKDYKFFFYNGKFMFLQVDVDRMSSHKRGFYDNKYKFLDFSTKYPLSEPQDKPSNYSEMINIATKLAKHFDGIIRIDLYSNGSDIKVGEITNCHGSAREKVIPEGKQVILDDYL